MSIFCTKAGSCADKHGYILTQWGRQHRVLVFWVKELTVYLVCVATFNISPTCVCVRTMHNKPGSVFKAKTLSFICFAAMDECMNKSWLQRAFIVLCYPFHRVWLTAEIDCLAEVSVTEKVNSSLTMINVYLYMILHYIMHMCKQWTPNHFSSSHMAWYEASITQDVAR